MFHISCLKGKLSEQIHPLSSLLLVNASSELQPKQESIMDHRVKCHGHCTITKVLIKWIGATAENNTWELLWKLLETYPPYGQCSLIVEACYGLVEEQMG
ncbi:hypothetical protein CIPAW_10G148100 [Carya illinoinensis]|uniref:Chromo domain-containing protein n=1 Tax=Carya illinoinensis TaxID=32201 RepID=A0A8T1PBJ3_CARIL|nr:hypothetical protein CIPAW_10G148100 [Carya illinoinensis]